MKRNKGKNSMCKMSSRNIVTIVLPVILAILVFIALEPTVSAATIYTVHPTDPNANFTTIQAAIDYASDEDSIEVWNETYIENVNVNRQLNIYARDGPSVTTVAAAIPTDHVFEVTVNNVNICGFTVRDATGSGKAGIYLNSVSYCNISNNIVSSNSHGIYLNPSNYNTIIGNSIRFNTNYGLYVYNSDYNEIAGNDVSNNNYGMYLYSTENSNVYDNSISFNTYDGISLYYSSDSEIRNNTVNRNERYGIQLGSGSENNNLTQNSMNYNDDYGLYIHSCRNYISPDNVANGENIYHYYKVYGTPGDPIVVEDLTLTGVKVINLAKITLCDSRYILVRNNTVANSGKGIYVDSSDYNEISDNTATDNDHGIYLNPSNHNKIIGNSVRFNTKYGLYIYNSDYNEIAGNDVSNSNYGMYLYSAENNNMYDNSISFNTYDGLSLYYSSDNEIRNNTVNHNERYGIQISYGSVDNNLTQNSMNYNDDYGLYIYSCRNYISPDNVVLRYMQPSENIYHFYKAYGTPDDPIVVEDLTLTGVKVINLAKITLCDSRYILVRNNTVANSGKGIYVDSSNYNEISNNTATDNDHGIYLNPSDYNKINGNSIRSSTYDGIYLSNSDYNEISGNTVEWNERYGIQLGSGSENNNLTQNSMNYNDDYGLYIHSCRNYISPDNVANGENIYHYYKVYGTPGDPIVVEDLTLTGVKVINLAKITLCDSRYILVRNNTVANSGKGIYVDSSDYNEISDNTATDNDHGIYLNPSNYNTISGNSLRFNTKYGMHIHSSDYNEIAGNDVSNSNYGLYLYSVENSNVHDNSISFNTYDGIALYYSPDNEIRNNTVNHNGRYGIQISYGCVDNILNSNTISLNNNNGMHIYSSDNEVTNNTVKWNEGYGIRISASNNLIYNNYFNNTNNAYDSGTNRWNVTKQGGLNIIGGHYLGGNYWSDYTGEDSDGDGLGDTPYTIPGGTNKDYLPLVTALPADLVISEKWVCWPDNCTICYNVTNIGNKTVTKGHHTALYVDDLAVAYDSVPVNLTHNESYIGCFDTYTWNYTPPADNITVCADSTNTVKELSETNNCLTTVWICGDVNGNEDVDMSDVIDLLYYAGYPGQYTIWSEWSADVNGDKQIDMTDVRALLHYVGYPGQYELNCGCR